MPNKNNDETVIPYDDESITWHNPYDQELREQDSIRRGDINSLQRCWNEKYTGKVGRLARDPIRHMKNLAIGIITLSSRSAINGGLNPETVLSIVDSTIMKIEHTMTDCDEIGKTIRKTQLMFAKMVNENNNKKTYNPIINKAKDYVYRNIHEKIMVSEIAQWLDINADYLSSLFHASEHKTLTQYILDEKIKLCCNMLKFSEYTIQNIASYFGFYSQSHFTKQFKACTGMTPGEYRKKYGISR